MRKEVVIVTLLLASLTINNSLSARIVNMPTEANRKRIALVLTGGGARSLSQIGVLRYLEKNNLVPDVIVGTSMGAIIGGLWAAGYSADRLDSLFRHVMWERVLAISDETDRSIIPLQLKAERDRSLLTLRFRDFSFLAPTAIGGSARFVSLLQELVWNSPYRMATDFDSLRVPFRAVSTNLSTGEWILLDKGNLATAMRVSASFPLRYTPWRTNDDVLVDGGLVANIGVEPARSLGADMIIVVNTVSNLRAPDDLDTPLAIADQALSSAMKLRDAEHLSNATLVITPELGNLETFDFRNVQWVIRQGELDARKHGSPLKAIWNNLNPGATDGYSNQHSSSNANPDTLGVSFRDIQLDFTGAETDDFDKYNALHHEVGTMLSSPTTTATVRAVVSQALLQVGFDFARVTQISVADSTLYITCDPGILTHIVIDPARRIDSSLAARDFAFSIGKPLSVAQVRKTWSNLRGSLHFEDVDLTVVRHTNSSGLAVVVGGEDLGNQMLRLGARADNERYAQASLEAIDQDVLGLGIRSGFRVGGGQRNGEVTAYVDLPRIFGTLWTASAIGYSNFRNVWQYIGEANRPVIEPLRTRTGERIEERTGFRLMGGRQIDRNGIILGEFRYEIQRFRAPDEAIPFNVLGLVRGLARWDDRDRIDFPTMGSMFDVSLETTVPGVSHGLSFTRMRLHYTGTQSIAIVSITPSFLIGAGDRTMPAIEHYSLGGQHSFFGLREDEERGRQIATGSIDLRIKLPFRLFFPAYVSMRYDLGSVWENPEHIRISDMQHSVGSTLGFDTSVGPAAFSLGRRFYFLKNPNQVAWGPILAYFMIGMRI